MKTTFNHPHPPATVLILRPWLVHARWIHREVTAWFTAEVKPIDVREDVGSMKYIIKMVSRNILDDKKAWGWEAGIGFDDGSWPPYGGTPDE